MQIFNKKLLTSFLGQETYEWVKSSASCEISAIRGIIFGAISSRFWMLRVHINSILNNNELPFYNWECITIETPSKNLNLVIKNESEMIKLITLIT